MSDKLPWYLPSENFDWKITLKKFFIAYFLSLIGVILPFTINFIQGYEWPSDVAIYIPLVVAILSALENLIKHWHM